MKKLLLFLFLIPNLVMAETWVCHDTDNNTVNTTTYKRLNKEEFDTSYGRYKISHENDERIVLSWHHVPFPVTTILFKTNQNKFFTTIMDEDQDVDTWKGDCEVVE